MIVRHRQRVCCAAAVLAAVVLSMPAAMAQPGPQQRIVYERPKPATVQPTARVAELVAELSDDSREKREAAARALLEMGPPIQPQLQSALEREQAAVPAEELRVGPVPGSNRMQMGRGYVLPRYAYHELRVLIDHMDERRHTAGSVITLHYKDAPLTDALRDLGKQADTDVGVESFATLDWVASTRATVDVEGVNFWQALRAIQQNTGAGPVYYAGGNWLRLDMRNSSVPLGAAGAVASGPVLIVPISAQHTQSGGVRLTLQAFVEPKVSNSGVHAMVQLDECVDEQGRSLLPPGPRTFASSRNQNHWTWKVPIDLAAVGPGRRIKTIKGRFGIGVGPADQIMTLANLAQAQGKSIRLDGVEVMVRRFTATGSQHRVDLEASAPAGSPYTLIFSTEPGAYLWDDSRQTVLAHRTFGGVRREADREVASWSLVTGENAAAPATLVWKPPASPAETRWFTVPFELHGLAIASSVE
jgi:hypothetical protein